MDAHKDTLVACFLDPDGTIARRGTWPNTPTGRQDLVNAVAEDATLVLEVGTYGKPLARHARDEGREVVLAETRELRRRAGTDVKTDDRDAYELANQHRIGVIKPAYLPTREEEALRSLVRHRIDLTHKITLVKNQVHAILARNGQRATRRSEALFTKKGLRLLPKVDLPPEERFVLDYHLRELDFLTGQVRAADAALADHAAHDQRVQRLMTIRGVGYYAACIIVAEIGDANRFPTAKKLASYAGLVPREHQSGQTHYRGSITKNGPGNLRWILTVCANGVIKYKGRFKRFYQRIARRRGGNRAKIAVAHKLLTIVWTLWTRREEYEEKEDDLTYQKVRRMRRQGRPIPEVDLAAAATRLAGDQRQKILRKEAAL